MNPVDMKSKVAKITNSPFFKLPVYTLIAMIIGIGAMWVLLGIASPVLLCLLIMKW